MRSLISLTNLAIVLALACLAVAAYKVVPLLRPQADIMLATVAGCKLNENACNAELPGGARVELAITPRPLPLVKPLQVTVGVTGMSATQVEIDFTGVSMDMGHNRQILTADGEGHYRGSAMLPVCVTGRMVWLATLFVDSGGRRIAVPFRFEAPLAGN